VQSGGVVAATLPLSILNDPSVKKQLPSGLTTTFLIVTRQRESRVVTGARIEIRSDLWDELASLDALEKWWRTPLHPFATSAPRVGLQVDLSVLPFSAAEEADAREWITKSGGVGTGGGSGGLVDTLIGTTITAKALPSYRWNVELAVQ
jgi:hypothetical protein